MYKPNQAMTYVLAASLLLTSNFYSSSARATDVSPVGQIPTGPSLLAPKCAPGTNWVTGVADTVGECVTITPRPVAPYVPPTVTKPYNIPIKSCWRRLIPVVVGAVALNVVCALDASASNAGEDPTDPQMPAYLACVAALNAYTGGPADGTTADQLLNQLQACDQQFPQGGFSNPTQGNLGCNDQIGTTGVYNGYLGTYTCNDVWATGSKDWSGVDSNTGGGSIPVQDLCNQMLASCNGQQAPQ